jgi:hypothetical protein
MACGMALLAALSAQAANGQVRSLGNAIGGALEKEAHTLQQASDHPANQVPETGKPSQQAPAPPAQRPQSRVVQMRLGKGDALADGAAVTCRQANGTTIRVSGGYRPAAADSGACR